MGIIKLSLKEEKLGFLKIFNVLFEDTTSNTGLLSDKL
jgi:hypothetical protein